MTSTTASSNRTRARSEGQKVLFIAAAGVLVGSFLPWLQTGIGTFGGFAGAGLWTFYAGTLGLAGALVPNRWFALAQAVIMASAAIILPSWQFWRLFSRVRFDGWSPGIGLIAVFGSGLLAAYAAWLLSSD